MLFRRGKKYRWEPVPCGVGTVINILEQSKDSTVQLVVRYHEEYYKIGVASDYNRQTRSFFDTVFYLNDQEYELLNAFRASATIDGMNIMDIHDSLEIVEADEGNPRNLTILNGLQNS